MPPRRRHRACDKRSTRSSASQVSTDQWLHWGVLAANAALALWDFEGWADVSARHVELARGSGALAPLAGALNVHRVVAIWRGDFEAATRTGRGGGGRQGGDGDPTGLLRRPLPRRLPGQPEEAMPLITATADEALARGEGLG